MANYPTSLDAFTNPTGVDSLSSPSHSLQHSDANDAIEALEAKVGIGTSTAGSATAGHVLVASTGGTTTWTTVSAGAISTTGGTAGQYLSAGTAGVASWESVPAAGLTLVKSQVVGSAVSNVNVTDAFSTTYDNYKIVYSNGVSSASGSILFKLGASSASYYSNELYAVFNSTTVTSSNYSNQSTWKAGVSTASSATHLNIDLFSPFLSVNTFFTGASILLTSSGDNGIFGGWHNVAASYTDFTLSASGTFTGGTIYVYGYKK
jgi:hypothetical protein